ncbi:hypothetical protein ACIP4Y_35875 [Streptomyces sp. NPDC088810]|uniref:nSTAND1 domain-containing NTPase n=1 Tax=Streptomyces sp. NPDC088810 TaxID=3365904 RepID=UPI003812BEBE
MVGGQAVCVCIASSPESMTTPHRRNPAARPGLRLESHPPALLRAGDDAGDTLVVVDQFEELFTLCADPAERQACLNLFLTAKYPPTQSGPDQPHTGIANPMTATRPAATQPVAAVWSPHDSQDHNSHHRETRHNPPHPH